jgi:hypothetical protein
MNLTVAVALALLASSALATAPTCINNTTCAAANNFTLKVATLNLMLDEFSALREERIPAQIDFLNNGSDFGTLPPIEVFPFYMKTFLTVRKQMFYACKSCGTLPFDLESLARYPQNIRIRQSFHLFNRIRARLVFQPATRQSCALSVVAWLGLPAIIHR